MQSFNKLDTPLEKRGKCLNSVIEMRTHHGQTQRSKNAWGYLLYKFLFLFNWSNYKEPTKLARPSNVLINPPRWTLLRCRRKFTGGSKIGSPSHKAYGPPNISFHLQTYLGFLSSSKQRRLKSFDHPLAPPSKICRLKNTLQNMQLTHVWLLRHPSTFKLNCIKQ